MHIKIIRDKNDIFLCILKNKHFRVQYADL